MFGKISTYFRKLNNKSLNSYSDNSDFPLALHEWKLLQQYTSTTISYGALYDYKYNVKGNSYDSDDIVTKKLMRNIVLGELQEDMSKGDIKQYAYGNLLIVYNPYKNAIVGVKNRRGKFDFNIDKEKKQWIDKFLGI